jgi:hypothetical protein
VMAPSTGVDSFLLHHHPEKMFLELEPLWNNSSVWGVISRRA